MPGASLSSVTEIHYTTTSIWNSIQKMIPQRELYSRHLKIQWSSLLVDAFIPKIGRPHHAQSKRSILKAKATDIHKNEDDLYRWILSKGLSLHPNQALAIKRAYQHGHVLFSIWVVPPKEHSQSSSTWTSTWVVHHQASTPHLWTLNAVQIHPLLSSPSPTFPIEVTFLTEWPALIDLNDPSSIHNSLSPSTETKSAFSASKSPLFSVELSRQQVNRLNATLRSTYWGFKRGGMMTHFRFSSLSDLHQFSFKPTSSRNEIKPKPVYKKQVHHVVVPIEILGCALFILWWLWFRYAQRDSLA